MPKIRRRVVCGLSETIATLPPQSALTSVDFPTFGRPATATKPLFTSAASPNRSRAGLATARRCTNSPAGQNRLERTRSQLERIGEQLLGPSRDHLARGARVDHVFEPELDEPLAA